MFKLPSQTWCILIQIHGSCKKRRWCPAVQRRFLWGKWESLDRSFWPWRRPRLLETSRSKLTEAIHLHVCQPPERSIRELKRALYHPVCYCPVNDRHTLAYRKGMPPVCNEPTAVAIMANYTRWQSVETLGNPKAIGPHALTTHPAAVNT